MLIQEISFNIIQNIKKKYNTSFEVAAIRYSKFNPGKCCFIVADFINPEFCNHKIINKLYAVKVRYAISSKHFPTYIAQDRLIAKDSLTYGLFFESWSNKRTIAREIPISDFGSSKKFTCNAEVKAIGNKVAYILLWLPEQEYRLL